MISSVLDSVLPHQAFIRHTNYPGPDLPAIVTVWVKYSSYCNPSLHVWWCAGGGEQAAASNQNLKSQLCRLAVIIRDQFVLKQCGEGTVKESSYLTRASVLYFIHKEHRAKS